MTDTCQSAIYGNKKGFYAARCWRRDSKSSFVLRRFFALFLNWRTRSRGKPSLAPISSAVYFLSVSIPYDIWSKRLSISNCERSFRRLVHIQDGDNKAHPLNPHQI